MGGLIKIIKYYWKILMKLIFPICFFRNGRKIVNELIRSCEEYRDESYSILRRIEFMHDEVLFKQPYSVYVIYRESYSKFFTIERELTSLTNELNNKKLFSSSRAHLFEILLGDKKNTIEYLEYTVASLEDRLSIKKKKYKQIFCEIDPYGEESWEED